MTSNLVNEGAEPKAKAALLNFLRSQRILSHQSVVTTELILDKQAARADVVLFDSTTLCCFEIKTARDSLARLDKQLEVYRTHAEFVTVVAATRHISAVMSRVPGHVGIIELLAFKPTAELRVVREAARSPAFDVNAMLSLVPVTELRTRLSLTGRAKRNETVAVAASLPESTKKEAVLSFLRDRYRPNSVALMRATSRRKIKPEDLNILRRWPQRKIDEANQDSVDGMGLATNGCPDQETYFHVGRAFGPVPEEVRALLAR